MDRAHLEEARYFEDRAADAMVHLERAAKARLRGQRNSFAEPVDYAAMGDQYHALAQVQLILREFKDSGIPVPEYVREAWREEARVR